MRTTEELTNIAQECTKLLQDKNLKRDELIAILGIMTAVVTAELAISPGPDEK